MRESGSESEDRRREIPTNSTGESVGKGLGSSVYLLIKEGWMRKATPPPRSERPPGTSMYGLGSQERLQNLVSWMAAMSMLCVWRWSRVSSSFGMRLLQLN